MKKIFQLAIGMVFLSNFATAQNEIDALRYSQLGFFGGTARSAGMAGSFGALGGDFSTLSTNPAGIGMYRKSEITFTPTFFNISSSSNLNGTSLQDSKPDFNFGNIGVVLAHYNAESKNDWKGFSFGFGYNRTNDFNSRIEMQGKNSNSSLMDIYLNDAIHNNGINSDLFGTQLAWNTYLINYDSLNKTYYQVLPNHGETQSKNIETSGSMGETVFSLGGNYDDKLYLGGTIGIPRIRYTESSQYTESIANDTIYGFKSFSLNQNFTTTGSGVNFKFGMIYKPADWIRIGGAFHSPSYFHMHDEYNNYMTSHFTNFDTTAYSPKGSYDYSLTTPMRAIGSLGFVINKMGIINVDYEYVNYASTLLHFPSADFQSQNQANQAISNKYTATGNLRVGTEWRVLKPMSIRAGVAYYGSPYKQGVGNDGSRICYTGGIGFREANYFLDFAYVYTQSKENYYFYNPSDAYVDPSVNTLKSSSVMMTLGFKF